MSDAIDEVVAEARPPEDGGVAWVELMRWSAIVAIVVVALINILGGMVIPPLVVFGLLWIGGLGWLTRATKGPSILYLVTFVAFIALSAPFTISLFMVPVLAGDFVLNLAGVLTALAGIVAAIMILRGQMGVSKTAATLARAAVAVFVVGAAVSIFSMVTYDDAVAQEDDLRVVTEDIEFGPTILEAPSGEVSVFVENKDQTLHTFTIEELDVGLDIPASKSARVTFDAEPGEYEFFCEPHKEDMKGTITIE